MNRAGQLFLTLLAGALFWAHGAALGQSAHASRQVADGIVFHYGLVPAELVLGHLETHAERQMHGGGRLGESHLILALFDARQKTRLAQADVTVQISLPDGQVLSQRLEPMVISGQPGFGGFASVGDPGVYKIRFDVRRPGTSTVSTAQFEYRVSPDLRP